MAELKNFVGSPTAQQLIQSGKIVRTLDLSGSSNGCLLRLPREIAVEIEHGSHVVEHEPVWFPSYPYEWPPDMLFAAGELTIELAQRLFDASFSLKDATPYNVLFCGPKPVFIDVLSFERHLEGDSRWLPYGQFLRTFILPLLMSKHFGGSLAEIFLTHRDGLEPEKVYPHITWPQRLRPPFLTTVSLPAWLGRRVKAGASDLYRRDTSMDPEKAEFILRSQLRRARKLLETAKPFSGKPSTWSSYTQTLSYAADDYSRKLCLVQQWLAKTRPASLLDVGCNTGDFSQVAAESGARVVAIDTDPVVVGLTWQRAVMSNLDILPLVVNFGWPSPAVGWRNAEYRSFLDRAAGLFDTVMLLAVLHHLLVTERIPLGQVVEVCEKLTNKDLIIEYVSKDDEMFRSLMRGRDSLHHDFTQEAFEQAFRGRFELVQKTQVKGNLRWLYLLQKTSGSNRQH
jgi:2-polyprenyl-3-methyl-5-hydroxy-6-metoxy-1,4-benzoquinol methylase